VYPVNPRLQEAEGDVCYASLSKLPGIPDVVNIVVPPGVAAGIVKEAVELGIKKIWLQPGSESEEAIEYCKKHNVEVLHNVCIMIERRKIKRGKKCHIK
jgi:predicted CoA-binding protein